MPLFTFAPLQLLHKDIFVSSSTWTKDNRASFIFIDVIGGGGGGGMGNVILLGGCGGGGGARVSEWFPATDLSASETVTVGRGGGGGQSGGSGSSGGLSSFGNTTLPWLIAFGGGGAPSTETDASGGGGGGIQSAGAIGIATGSAQGGQPNNQTATFLTVGQYGGAGSTSGSSLSSIWGGASGGGETLATQIVRKGSNSYFAGGGGGAGGSFLNNFGRNGGSSGARNDLTTDEGGGVGGLVAASGGNGDTANGASVFQVLDTYAGAGSQSSVTVTLENVVAGSTIVVFLTWDTVGGPTGTVTDPTNGSYTSIRSDSDATAAQKIQSFYVVNIASAATLVITGKLSVGATSFQIAAVELGCVSTLDASTGSVQNPTPGTGSNAVTSLGVSNTNQPAFMLAISLDNNTASPGIGSGFTNLGQIWKFGTAAGFARLEFKHITTTSTPVSATFTGRAACVTTTQMLMFDELPGFVPTLQSNGVGRGGGGGSSGDVLASGDPRGGDGGNGGVPGGGGGGGGSCQGSYSVNRTVVTGVTASSVTPIFDNERLLMFFVGGANRITTPAGMTHEITGTTTAGNVFDVYDQALGAAASTGDKLATLTSDMAFCIMGGLVPNGTITLRATSTSNSFTGSLPAGTVNHDVMVAQVVSIGNTQQNLIAPSGWVMQALFNASTPQVLTTAIYTKVAGGAEPSTYVWSSVTANNVGVSIISYSGVDNTNPWDTTTVGPPGKGGLGGRGEVRVYQYG